MSPYPRLTAGAYQPPPSRRFAAGLPPPQAREGLGLVSRGSPASFCGEEALGEAREKADPDRDRAVVEIVARVVQQAAALARAVADPQHRPRPRLQHVGEILAAERR